MKIITEEMLITDFHNNSSKQSKVTKIRPEFYIICNLSVFFNI